MTRLSAVVPTLNAERDLRPCLAALADADELIVVDGGSTDDTVAVAREAGAQVIAARRGRGTQLHAGAAAASGEWLLFVHADTVLEPNWRFAVEQHVANLPHHAAHLRLRLRSPAWQARLIEQGVAWRSRLLALPYGDQGLLVSRRLYMGVGGYAPLPLLEDVDLVRRLGRSRLAPMQATAWTSASRWEQDGWFARSARNLLCILLWRLGAAPERIARLYR